MFSVCDAFHSCIHHNVLISIVNESSKSNLKQKFASKSHTIIIIPFVLGFILVKICILLWKYKEEKTVKLLHCGGRRSKQLQNGLKSTVETKFICIDGSDYSHYNDYVNKPPLYWRLSLSHRIVPQLNIDEKISNRDSKYIHI